jgi:hypothetical protein
MKPRLTVLSLMVALAVVAGITGAALAQEDTMPARPMYAHLKPSLPAQIQPPVTPLPLWRGSYVYSGHTYSYTMVGTAPSKGTSTTVPTFIIPVTLVYVTKTGTVTFTPTHKLSNGQTVLQNTIASPIFKSGITFMRGGTDLGDTQYIDAFQRGNFWGTVSKHTGYHLLLGAPKVLPTLTLTVPKIDGKVATEFGISVGLADINYFDAQLQAYIATHSQIVPNSLPIFVTYNAYLTQGGCCIGGYHNFNGTQAYAHFTYIGKVGAFAQDVSALSHEVGEWADDPQGANTNVPVLCGITGSQILEVGDPEEGFANYGGFAYTLGGFTYNLQDLTFLPYFGAPSSTSANGSMTFQGNPFGLTVCSNGG